MRNYSNLNQNYQCSGAWCNSPTGEVRVLPTGRTDDLEGTKAAEGHGNAILCHACYEEEMRFRRIRNLELGNPNAFKLPAWEKLKVYEG